jgi:hypothetical protein
MSLRKTGSDHCYSTFPAMSFTPLFVRLCISLSVMISLISCSIFRKSDKDKGSTKMTIIETTDVIDLTLLKPQKVPTFASRGGNDRGIVPLGMTGAAVSLATNAIKKVIAEEQKRYVAEYAFALTDLYFYDQLSDESAFDPLGMQFSGFKLIRFNGAADSKDTAMVAIFELDDSNPYEIINNSVFRLKLKSLDIKNLKAKMAPGSKNKANMDFEITFKTSYVNESGQLFDNVVLGKFLMLIRSAPLGESQQTKDSYLADLRGKRLDGKSFIVPRSFGYKIGSSARTEGTFSQGMYSIEVKVKESTKDTFINKVITDNSDKVIELLEKEAKKKIK